MGYSLGQCIQAIPNQRIPHVGLPLKAFERYIHLHLQCWQHLARNFQVKGMFLFRLRPKCHYFQHTCMDVRRNRLNPRLAHSCMYDESYLGYIKRVAIMCHSGSMIKTRFFQRYLMFMANRFENHRACAGDSRRL